MKPMTFWKFFSWYTLAGLLTAAIIFVISFCLGGRVSVKRIASVQKDPGSASLYDEQAD